MPTRILVVEDSRTQAEQLEAVLEGGGYDVEVAFDGDAALTALEQRSHDAVISDIVMPGAVDGYELCRRIKAGPRRDTPVVLLTSLSDPADIILALECGADNFLRKPYDPANLLDRLRILFTTREIRAKDRVKLGVKVLFMGREVVITSDHQQVLDLLVSTFEEAVLQNRELRQREEELRIAKAELDRYAGALERRLQSVLETIPDVLFSVDTSFGDVFYVSPAAARVFGYTDEEILADPKLPRRSVHPEDLPTLLDAFGRAIGGRRPESVECRFKTKDRDWRWLQLNVAAVPDDARGGLRLDGVARDVTERREAEEALRRVEQQLRFAQKMEAIGQMAGGVAHDFNNLLGAMKAATDLMLLEKGLPDAVRELLTDITGIVDRGRNLTRQLLAFSRRQALDVRSVDVNALLGQQVKMVRRLISEDIRLETSRCKEATTVLSDAGQVEQVVMNLCLNARDAMPNGGSLVISTERVRVADAQLDKSPWARPGDYVRLSVADTGTGMDEEMLAQIFQPFFTTKESGRGTGLGLSVVYGIVKQHGGFINVRSRPGEGTTFDVFLPFYPAAAAPARAPAVGGYVGGTETILLADDEEALRTTARKILERLGYRVIVAADGDEALKLLEERGSEVRLVVADVVMPKLGGPALRAMIGPRRPDLRFLFATGYSPESSRLRSQLVRAEEVLTKPYGIVELAQAVRGALDRHTA